MADITSLIPSVDASRQAQTAIAGQVAENRTLLAGVVSNVQQQLSPDNVNAVKEKLAEVSPTLTGALTGSSGAISGGLQSLTSNIGGATISQDMMRDLSSGVPAREIVGLAPMISGIKEGFPNSDLSDLMGNINNAVPSDISGVAEKFLTTSPSEILNGQTGLGGGEGSFGGLDSLTGLIPSAGDASSIIGRGLSGLNNPFGGIGGIGGFGTGSNRAMTQKGERLYTIRSRAAQALYAAKFDNSGNSYIVDRGPISRLRLLTGDTPKELQSRLNKNIVGTERQLLSGAVDKLVSKTGFQDFMLTDVQVSFNEKVQITEVFGDANVVYYFGKSPVIYNVSGMIFDSIDNNWFVQFLETYGEVLRGSRLAANYQLIELTLPNVRVIGSIMGMSYSQNSARDTDIPFNMQIIAKEVIPLAVNIAQYTQNAKSLVINFSNVSSLTGFLSFFNVNSLKSILSGGNPLDSTNSSLMPSATGTLSGGASSADVFQNSIFSPIYGVITSITKVLFSSTGSISSVVGGFSSEVTSVLRGVSSAAVQFTSVIQLTENSLNSIIQQPINILNQLRSTIQTLKNTAGVITNVPQTITSILQRLTGSGNILTGAAYLSGGINGGSKIALLSAGTGNTSRSAILSSGNTNKNNSASLGTGNGYSIIKSAYL